MNEQSMGAQGAQRPGLKPVSNLLKDVWAQYNKHFNVLVPIMLVSGVGLILQSLIKFAPNNGEGMVAILALLATLIYIAGSIWGSTALYNRILKLDQPMSVKQAFDAAKPYIWPMILVGILTFIAVMVGLILVIIPGIIVGVWVSFAYFLVIDENKGGVDALKASKAYVEGYWLAVFGRYVVLIAIFIVIFGVIGGILMTVIGQALGNLVINIASLIITPFAVLYQYDMYKNLKQVKSGATPMSSPAPSAPAGNV